MEGKPQLSHLLDFPNAIKELTLALTEGTEKYGRMNWAKGMPPEEIVDSLLRHLMAWRSGEMVDPDSKSKATHLAKVLSNALMLCELHGHRFYTEGDLGGR